MPRYPTTDEAEPQKPADRTFTAPRSSSTPPPASGSTAADPFERIVKLLTSIIQSRQASTPPNIGASPAPLNLNPQTVAAYNQLRTGNQLGMGLGFNFSAPFQSMNPGGNPANAGLVGGGKPNVNRLKKMRTSMPNTSDQRKEENFGPNTYA